MTTLNEVAFPRLVEAQLDRLRAYGNDRDVLVGEELFRAGDASYDMVVVRSGAVELVREATAELPEVVLARHGAGHFLGELSLLTGQAIELTARVVEAGRVTAITPPDFRRLMDGDPKLSNVILRALVARRKALLTGDGARSVEILGSVMSASALALRTWAARELLPHTWVDVDSPTGVALARAIDADADDLPAVVTPTAVLRRTTPGGLAELLGLSYRPSTTDPSEVVDLVVVGGGPAGLAAAVYGHPKASQHW